MIHSSIVSDLYYPQFIVIDLNRLVLYNTRPNYPVPTWQK